MSLDVHPQLPDDSLPIRDDTHKIRRLPCCLYLENSEGKTLIKLNDSSSLVWSLCNGEFSVREIIDLLEESYPDARDIISKDVYRVLDEFIAEDIIKIQS
ncbi:MAG: PqqD family protein [Gammaproteobacteria bacterium]|nr:PqqD family protein [Gammaproteobacteria bacterium]